MKFFRVLPTYTYLLIIYNLIVLAGTNAQETVESAWLEFFLMSGAVLRLTVGDILVIAGIIVLYVEIFRSTRPTSMTIIDHTLSLIVFVIFLVEFIVASSAGTSTFFILTLMSFLDVVAGFTVSISSARRDIAMQ